MTAYNHAHLPRRGDPNTCAECSQPWNSVRHQPSLIVQATEVLRTVSEGVPGPRALEQHERASGAPFRPSGGTIWGDGQPSPETFRKITQVQDSTVYEVGTATRCPECGDPVPNDRLLLHMREVCAADQRDIDQMADMLGLPRLPAPDLLPDALKKAMDERKLEAERVAAFLNPEIPTEQLMTDMANAEAIDPEELNKAMNAMVPAQLEALLTEWWMDRAEEEARAVVPKAVTYGSNSLLQLGRKMAQLQNREVTDEEAMELGCWVYVVGKVERWTDAVMRGERPSDDTIYDVGIYVKMTQRLRDVGSWPGVPK